MELIESRIEPAGPDRVRLAGDVRYADSRSETYWFEVPAALADDLSRSGNPWLTALLPLAAKLGEPLRIPLPVDRLLARNLAELARIWRGWYPSLSEPALDLRVCDSVVARPPGLPGRTAAFFSGGVDSFFTVLRNDEAAPGRIRIDELIPIQGFDFPLDRAEAFDKHLERLRRAADDLGKTVVPVRTNLRETRLRECSWAELWHGAALASVGLALERRYRHVFIAASSVYEEVEPLGSHPLTDHLLSTSATQFVHDGAGATRLEKTTRIAASDLALRALHVCYREKESDNCGRCRKCSLTMATLSALGVLDRAATFPKSVDLERVRRIYLPSPMQRRSVRRLVRLASTRRHGELASALDKAVRSSAVRVRLLKTVRAAMPFSALSPVARRLRRAILNGAIQ